MHSPLVHPVCSIRNSILLERELENLNLKAILNKSNFFVCAFLIEQKIYTKPKNQTSHLPLEFSYGHTNCTLFKKLPYFATTTSGSGLGTWVDSGFPLILLK